MEASSDAKPDNTSVAEEDDKLYKRLELELRGHDPAVIKSYVKFATTAAEHLRIDVGKWYRSFFAANVLT